MRRRICVWISLAVVVAAGSVLSHSGLPAQTPPKALPPDITAPPIAKGVVPAAAVGRKLAPFDRFRKYDELPELTRQIVFSTQKGMEWLSRDGIHQANGRFIPGLSPSLGKATEDDHFLRQAFGAFALARAARLTGEEKYAVRAGQTILSLLAETPKDPANPSTRKPVQPSMMCNRVGAAAYLAMAIYELPDAAAELIQCGEELCQFLKGNLQADGSLRYTEPDQTPDPDGINQYPGPALLALAMSQRSASAEWKADALRKAVSYYQTHFRENPELAFVPWMTSAFAEAHLVTKDATCAEFVFAMTDWMQKLQYDSPERQRAAWRGGFPTVSAGKLIQSPPTVDTAYYSMGLADACRMIRQMERPDVTRYDQYRLTLTRALQFLTTLQYEEENTLHFTPQFQMKVLGAFHPSATDGNLRVDHTAAAVVALSGYLIAGADR
jgi:hypothetical protein